MLVAFEGIDGCGKGTQTQQLTDRAVAAGLSVATFSFPRYGTNAFSRATSRYLNGEFGSLSEVPPEFAAMLFAGDRLAARGELLEAVAERDLVICDRYVPSNLAHQAAKLPPARRPDFLRWVEEIEYGIHAMPRPDVAVLLTLPVEKATELIGRKQQRSYTSLKADIHEADVGYLQACDEVYRFLSQHEADRWLVIDSLDARTALRPPEDIGQEIWPRLRERLAARGRSSA